MEFTKEERQFPSASGQHQVTYYIYKPLGEIRAMIQLVHGMAEHLERYESYIENFTKQGFLVFGDTHIGHKKSAGDREILGYFGEKDGWRSMVEDEKKLTKIMKKEYPNVPVFLYGHSMGSLISRAYIAEDASPFAGAIICGTASRNPLLGIGKAVTSLVKLGGAKKPSPMINKLMFGSYNSKIENPRTDFDWLTRDNAVVDAYIEDPYCGFLFTTQGYYDLECLLGYVTADEWFDKVPEDFPIFFIGGGDDPVGGWGKGYEEIDAGMKKKKRKDYRMKVYPGMRHELHNEIGKEEVISDLSEWIIGHLMM